MTDKVDYYAALLGLDLTTSKLRRIDIWDGNSKAERKNFYESLLRISWLAPEVRRAVFKALGRSVRAYKAEFSYGWAMAARHLIAEEKARLKKLGKKRPSEGLSLSDEVWLNVADRQGMTVEALKQRLYRSKPRKK